MLARSAQISRKSRQGLILSPTLNHLPEPGNNGFAEFIVCKWRILGQDVMIRRPCSFVGSVSIEMGFDVFGRPPGVS